MKHLLWLGLSLAMTVGAHAQAWMTAECTVQNGEKINVFIANGEARISYDGSRPQMAYPDWDDGIMSVVHIGHQANLVLSINTRTGRSFAIMLTDRGGRHEYNAICKINTGRRG